MRVTMVTEFPSAGGRVLGGVQEAAACLAEALVRVRADLDLHIVRWRVGDIECRCALDDLPYTVHDVLVGSVLVHTLAGLGPRQRVGAS